MKKNLFWMTTAFALLFSFNACSSDDDKDDNGGGGGKDPDPTPTVTIKATLPEDLDEVDLNYANPAKTVKFAWEGTGTDYSIEFSLSKDMTASAKFPVGTASTASLTHTQLDEIVGKAGVGDYKREKVYWRISDPKGNSDVRSMTVFRFCGPLTDARDGEVYQVIRVVDPATGDYAIWLAENIRTTKDASGNALPADKYKFYTDGGDDLKKQRGGYYQWATAMGGNEAAEQGRHNNPAKVFNKYIQGVAPKGWHIATDTDWAFLIDVANAAYGKEEPAPALRGKNGGWAAGTECADVVGFNARTTGFVAGAGVFNEVDINSYFWTANEPFAGDVYPWDTPVAEFPNKAISIRLDGGAEKGLAFWPYPKTEHYMVVRAVLD